MPSGRKKYSITALAYDKKGRLLSVGRNSYVKTHRLQAMYSKKVGRPNAIFLHAEIDALVKARGEVYKLVILRYQSDQKPACAKPCPACRLAIEDYGVKIVEHT